jgi:hypothetical protein
MSPALNRLLISSALVRPEQRQAMVGSVGDSAGIVLWLYSVVRGAACGSSFYVFNWCCDYGPRGENVKDSLTGVVHSTCMCLRIRTWLACGEVNLVP